MILLESAKPPLAIGLFGSWGSGKSTLMSRLRQEVRRQIKEMKERPEPPDTSDDIRRVRNVAQLEFNAWSFADSQNLWASLTAEIFEQLKAGGGRAMSRERGAALVDEVARKLALSEGETRIANETAESIQKALDELETKARKAKLEAEAMQRHAVTVAQLITGDGAALERRLKQALPNDDDAIAMDAHGRGLGRAWWLAKRMYPLWLYCAPVVALLALGAGVALLILRPELSQAWTVATAMALPVLSATILVGKPLLAALATAGRYDELVHLRKAKLAQEAAALQDEIEQKKVALGHAQHEEEERAARAASLAETKGHPARLLQYLLSNSADIQSIRQQVGLMVTVRRCFETLNALIMRGRTWKEPEQVGKVKKGKGAKPESETRVPATVPIDRIILYVDDLDRCSAEQVNRVLDAVHLLLAFQCFVVIVAIDVRWVRRSLVLNHPQFRRIPGEKQDEYARPSPSDYLEKIFQIPFWVRPLAPPVGSAANPYRNYLNTLVGEAAAVAPQSPASPAKARAGKNAAGAFQPVLPEAPEVADRARPERIRLTDAEQHLLDQLGPLAAKSPRAVKRLVNIYRLIRAGLTQEQEAAFFGPGSRDVPRFSYVLFALAIDAGIATTSIPQLVEAIVKLAPAEWTLIANDPHVLLDSAPDTAFKDVREPLIAAGRLDGFVAAVNALRHSASEPLNRDAIQDAFAMTQRYSFRAP